MHISVISVSISLPGCASLKEKRQRIGGLHERLGRNPAVAVCESGALNSLETSEWSFVVVAPSLKSLDALCSEIEIKLQRHVDGRVLEVVRELL